MPRDVFAQPLFSPKLIKTRFHVQPLPEAHREAIAHWAAQLKGGLGQIKETKLMNVQKILIPLAILGGAALAYRFYGWPGIAVVATFLVFGILLHFTRLMTILKRAANRPIGYVDSAVMLNAKLKPGATLLHVVAMTRALGLLKSIKGEQPEVFEWTDGSESTVTCTFVSGKLSHHVLNRPSAS